MKPAFITVLFLFSLNVFSGFKSSGMTQAHLDCDAFFKTAYESDGVAKQLALDFQKDICAHKVGTGEVYLLPRVLDRISSRTRRVKKGGRTWLAEITKIREAVLSKNFDIRQLVVIESERKKCEAAYTDKMARISKLKGSARRKASRDKFKNYCRTNMNKAEYEKTYAQEKSQADKHKEDKRIAAIAPTAIQAKLGSDALSFAQDKTSAESTKNSNQEIPSEEKKTQGVTQSLTVNSKKPSFQIQNSAASSVQAKKSSPKNDKGKFQEKGDMFRASLAVNKAKYEASKNIDCLVEPYKSDATKCPQAKETLTGGGDFRELKVGGMTLTEETVTEVTKTIQSCYDERKASAKDKASRERIKEECINKGKESCHQGYDCGIFADNFLAGADDINPRVYEEQAVEGASIASYTDAEIVAQNCLSYLVASKKRIAEGREQEGARPILSSILKPLDEYANEDGAELILSHRLDSISENIYIYGSENSCQEIFAKREEESFIGIRGNLNIRKKKEFCLDILQIGINKNLNNCRAAAAVLNKKIVEGAEGCKASRSTLGRMGEMNAAKLASAQTRFIEQHCGDIQKYVGRDDDTLNVDYKNCYDTYLAAYQKEQSQEGSNAGKVSAQCADAPAVVGACLNQTIASMSDKGGASSIVAGCVGLQQVASAIDTLNEDGKAQDTSLDGAINCQLHAQGSGISAIDYLACRKAINWYNITFLTVDTIAPVATQINQGFGQTRANRRIARSAIFGAGEDAQQAAFEAQKDILKEKQKSEDLMSVLHAGKAATTVTTFFSFPTPSEMSEWADGRLGDAPFELDQSVFAGLSRMTAVNRGIKSALFANQGAKSVLAKSAADSLAKSLIHGLQARQFRRQRRLVGDVQEGFEEAQEEIRQAQTETGATFCQLNPMLPSCRRRGRRIRGDGGLQFGGIGASGGNGASIGINGASKDANNFVRDDGVTPSEEEQEILSDILNEKESRDRKRASGPAAAKISSGGGGGGSGGGPGGGGAGGGGVASGGGSGGKPPGDTTSTAGLGEKTVGKYVSGGNRQFSSGGQIRNNRKKSGRNPFGGLSERRSKRAIASEEEKSVLPKKVKLFDAISSRYAKIHGADRLEIIDKKSKIR